jgi:hypothetical protein
MITVRRAFEQVDDEMNAAPKEKYRSEDWHPRLRIVVVPASSVGQAIRRVNCTVQSV